jgi:hypothetical protein
MQRCGGIRFMPMRGDAMKSGRNGSAPAVTGQRNMRGFAGVDYGKCPFKPAADVRLSERVRR